MRRVLLPTDGLLRVRSTAPPFPSNGKLEIEMHCCGFCFFLKILSLQSRPSRFGLSLLLRQLLLQSYREGNPNFGPDLEQIPSKMGKGGDVEMGIHGALYPNMMESPQMRWAFIRKVYSIVTLQILVTISVSAVVVFYRPIPEFFQSRTTPSVVALVLITISPLLVMLPMMQLRERHPWNLIFLGLFTICMSMVIGLACVTRSGKVIIEAAALTVVVVVGLTLYTFWAAKRGHDFNFLGPFLTTALLVMMIYLIIQVFLPVGRVGTTIYGCLAALVFAGFIIYDTDNLIKRHSYDEYVCASITLYLDIINLFVSILTAFSAADS